MAPPVQDTDACSQATIALENDLENDRQELADLQPKADRLKAECNDHDQAIKNARAECAKSPSAVLSLESEYRSLQNLHGWRITGASPFRLVFGDEIELMVPIVKGAAQLHGADLGLVTPTRDASTAGLLTLTHDALGSSPLETVQALVRATGQVWNAVRRLRDEFRIMKIYYPLAFVGNEQEFRAVATMVLPGPAAKVEVSFAVTAVTLLAWPGVKDVEVNVNVVYGNVK